MWVLLQVEASQGWSCGPRYNVSGRLEKNSTLGLLCILPVPSEHALFAFPEDIVATTHLLCSASSCAKCGDAVIEGGETCDDGVNTGNGCVACVKQEGYQCDSDGPCTLLPYCGDGILSAGEACDDGGLVSGDGCSATYVCDPMPACAVC